MHWKEKIKWAVEKVLNEGQDQTYYEVSFHGEDRFEVREITAGCGHDEAVYTCEWVNLKSHWRGAIRQTLTRIMEQRIIDVMEELDEKDPVDTGPLTNQ